MRATARGSGRRRWHGARRALIGPSRAGRRALTGRGDPDVRWLHAVTRVVVAARREGVVVTSVVLVVEDERKIRDLVRGYLEREGLQVLSTPSGAEALTMARDHRP